jgi:outer membrane protein assembly factor BamB
LAGVGLTATVRADDWPQWLGPQRDDIWRETGIVSEFPAGGPPVRWRIPIGPGYSGPAVAQGRVYVMDHILAKGAKLPTSAFARGNIAGGERVLCLNAADGKELWKHEYDCPYTVSYPSGPRTTPTVHEHKVYTLGTEGNLFCLDADTGHVIWSRDFKKEYGAKTPIWGFSAHPLLDGQTLICMVGGKGTTTVAFDKDTGKELWRALTAREPGYCPPMIYEAGGKRQLIIWDAEAVHGLDPETGTVYWSQPLQTYMGMSISTPRMARNLLFLTATNNTSLMLRLEANKPGAVVAWRGTSKTSISSVFGTPFVEDGYIYGTDNNGELRCIKADTGERVWGTLAPNGGKRASCADIFIIKNGDRFFLVTDQGNLILAHLSPKGYKEISRAHLLEPTTAGMGGRDVVWSHPAFANRCILARNDKEIICASLAAAESSK